MKLFDKVFRRPMPESTVADEMKCRKDRFFRDIEKQKDLRRQKLQQVSNNLMSNYTDKVAELGEEGARLWYQSEFERANQESAVKIKACEMYLYEDDFFRIVKSSPEIAAVSAEGHPFISSKPEAISEDLYKTYGLCFTTASSAIMYLSYGDEIAKLNFDPKAIEAFGLSDEIIMETTHQDPEFNADKLLIESKESLKFPETLKNIIRMSSDDALYRAIVGQQTLKYENAFKSFGCIDTLHAWQNVMKCANEFTPLTHQSCKFIRDNIDSIIPDFTIEDKIANLKNDAKETINTYGDMPKREEER